MALAIENEARFSPYVYSFCRIITRRFFIPEGCLETPFNIVSHNLLPTRLVAFLVDSKAWHGTLEKTPLLASHCNVERIYLRANDAIFPSTGTTDSIDFEHDNYVIPYMRLAQSIDPSGTTGVSGITYANYPLIACYFLFDLSITQASQLQLLRTATTQLYIKFRKPVQSGGLMLVCLLEAQTIMTVQPESATVVIEPAEI